MHLRRSNCAVQYRQHQMQTSRSQAAASAMPSVDSLFARPLLITVENFFAIIINVPILIKHARDLLMLLYGYANAFVDISGIFSSIVNGCIFVWTLCTDPDNISTPFLPNSVQPHWDSVYNSLNTHVDMTFWSARLFGVWKFLVTPIRIDPEALYARIEDNPNLPFWIKAALIRLGKMVELLIGSYLFSKMLAWSLNALVAFMLFTYFGLKQVVFRYLS